MLAANLPPRLLYEGIAESLRDRLFAHALPPGASVDEVALSRHYGVSRTPVREALKVLVNEGLLTLRNYSGCRVTRLAGDELGQLLDALALLDRHALRRLAEAPGERRRQVLAEWLAAPPGRWLHLGELARAALEAPACAAIGRQLLGQLRLALGPQLAACDNGLSGERRSSLADALLGGDATAVDAAAQLCQGALRRAALNAWPGHAAGETTTGSEQGGANHNI